MSDCNRTPFLESVKDALAAELIPGGSSAMKHMALMCGQRILARLLADSKHLPALRREADAQYGRWLTDVKHALGDSDQHLATYSEQSREVDPRSLSLAVRAQIMAASLSQSSAKAELSRGLLRRMVSIEYQAQSAYMSAYKSELNGASGNRGKADALPRQQMESLCTWLRKCFGESRELRVLTATKIPGGFSKQTLLICLDGTQTLPSSLVLRIDSTHLPGHSNLEDEHHIIQILLDAGVAVPDALALESSGTVLGAPFLLLRKIEGIVVGDVLDVSDGSREIALDLAVALARLHAVPVSRFGSRIDGAGESAQDRLLRDISTFETGWRQLNEPSVALEIAFAWLRENAALADGDRVLIHKDVGCHNILASEGRLTALLDWETAALGHPAQDLGYALPTVIQMCRWDDFMAAYVGAGGTAPTTAQIDYFSLWGHTWLTVMAMQARSAFLTGPVHDIRLGYAAAYLLIRFQSRLIDKLHAIF